MTLLKFVYSNLKSQLYKYTIWATAWQTNKMMRAQRRLRSACASAQSDQSSLCTLWVGKDPRFLHADSDDWSDWVAAQIDLCLRWAHSWFCCFVVLRHIFLMTFLMTKIQICQIWPMLWAGFPRILEFLKCPWFRHLLFKAMKMPWN